MSAPEAAHEDLDRAPARPLGARNYARVARAALLGWASYFLAVIVTFWILACLAAVLPIGLGGAAWGTVAAGVALLPVSMTLSSWLITGVAMRAGCARRAGANLAAATCALTGGVAILVALPHRGHLSLAAVATFLVVVLAASAIIGARTAYWLRRPALPGAHTPPQANAVGVAP